MKFIVLPYNPSFEGAQNRPGRCAYKHLSSISYGLPVALEIIVSGAFGLAFFIPQLRGA